MNKLILATIALGASMALASCSGEEFDVKPTGAEGNVTFTASLPASVASRAYSDGSAAKNLAYAIYLTGEKTPLLTGTATFNQLKATVSTTLATGKTYDVIFWAQADGAPYTFDNTTQKVTVNYDGIKANNESLDAFFHSETLTVNGPVNKPVTLLRPFAQVNVGTNDLKKAADAGAKVTTSSIALKTYTTLDLISGEVTGETTAPVTFAKAAIPSGESFPVDDYEYLAMAYVLVGADKQLVDITLGIDATTNEPVFAGVPVQRNYRTNIYGALLTNPAIFNVEINPDFGGGDIDVPVAPWDGTSVKMPVINEEAKTVAVAAPAELQGLAQLVNGANGQQPNDFEGYTVTLGSDIDFGGHEILPIADGSVRSGSNTSGPAFRGVLDGQGHIISNFKITNTANDANTGFIANLAGATAEVKNLKFKDIELAAPVCEQVGVVAIVSEGAKVSNIEVLSGSVSGKQGAGAIVGRMLKDGTIQGCSNGATVSTTTNNAGGIVGAAYYTEVGKTMVISDCSNTGEVRADNVAAGGIAGLCAADVTNCVNEGNISASNNSAGGIAGQQNARGTISGCVNKGNISGDESSILGFGGIIGWIKYDNCTTSYPNHSVIVVTGCENRGNIEVPKAYGVAGIVGLTYCNAEITSCKNYASRLTANNMVAGITAYQKIGTALPETTPHLTVTGCESTTNTATQMNGSLKAEIVYDNTTGGATTIEGNTYNPAE